MSDKTRTESNFAILSVDADSTDIVSATSMKQTLARAERLNGILRAIRNVNQLITKEDDLQRLIDGTCVNLTDTLSYHSAWIALLDDAGAVVTTAQSGLDGDFDLLRGRLLSGEFSDCMRRTLEADWVVTITDPIFECRGCSLAKTYRGRVSLTRRLAFRGKTYGFLAASVPQAYADDAEEQSLFDEVAGDLAFALHKIDMALRLGEIESDLKRARKLAYFGAWRFDLSTGCVIASDETRTIYGVADAELSIPYIQTVPLPPYRKVLDAALKALIEENAPYDVEFEIRRPSDGVIRWMHSVAEYDAVRNIVVGSIQDITERKRVEEALRASDEKFRSIFASMTEIVVLHELVCDGDGRPVNYRILDCNPAFTRITGIRHEEAVGRLATEVYGSDTAPYLDEYARVVQTGEPCTFITAYTPINKHFDICAVSLGKNLFVTVTTDITERETAQQELRRSINLLERIFEVLPVGLWLTDREGRLLRGNPAGVRIWGAEPKVSISEYGVFKAHRLPERTLVEADDWALAKTIREGATVVDELLEIEAFDGRRKTILNYTSPILAADGVMEGAIIVNLDVSDRFALEEQLRHAQKMESVGRLAGGVAHDFNNIIMGIQGYVELCQEAIDKDHPVHEWLGEIMHEAQRSANLTRQLLAFARKQTANPQVLDFNDVVTDMLKMLRRLIGEDIDLSWQPGAEAGAVKIDPGQVDQILANLCVNARDAINGAGKVTITTKKVFINADYCATHAEAMPGSYVMLAVGDTGCGMDRETLGNIFEPFFTTKGVGQGTGLGLATVYGIVRQNGGFVHVESELGQGATFTIYLPRHQAEAVREPEMKLVKPRVRGHETILLVEDESLILKMTTLRLQRDGYTVLAAETPGEAIRLATEHPGNLHLILSDVIMPDMNGRDLVDQILTLHPEAKSLFMSGYTADVIAHNGVLDEDINFIQKPFSTDDLLVKVRKVLEGE